MDYQLEPTVLTFPTGSAQGARQCMTVSVHDDVAVENNEMFHMILTPNDARVAISSICHRAPFTIIDTDGKTLVYSMAFHSTIGCFSIKCVAAGTV